jgi:hypothetical protein
MGNAVGKRISQDATVAAAFASLPLPLEKRIFLAVPAAARARASCVCRAWRDALADSSLWTRLDMSIALDNRELFRSVLRGAAAGRALGRLCQLDTSQKHVAWDVLLPVLTANAGSLRELKLKSVITDNFDTASEFPAVEAVVAAAPQLQVLTAENTWCTWEEAPWLLRAELPFAPLQMSGSLVVHFSDESGPFGGMERVGPFAAALADAALQPALLRLVICFADTTQPALMGALVDAALVRRLRELSLQCCAPPAAAPLARLLAKGSLVALEFCPTRVGDTPLFNAAGAAFVAHALRVNTTLTKLNLWHARLCLDMRVAGALLGALVGHPSLRELQIYGELITAAEDCSEFGAALAALVAADAPALHDLVCYGNTLGDAGLAPIFEALALNRHLRKLSCQNNSMSEAFARERLLPAVRANTTLQELQCGDYCSGPAVTKAEELVRRRRQHG